MDKLALKRVFKRRGGRFSPVWYYGRYPVAGLPHGDSFLDYPTIQQYLEHKEAEIWNLFGPGPEDIEGGERETAL